MKVARIYWRLRQRYTAWHAYNRLQKLRVDVVPGRRIGDEGNPIIGRLERLELAGTELVARGWVFDGTVPARGLTLCVQVGPVEHHYPMVYGIHRDDVTDAHDRLENPYVGFVLSERVLFPLRGTMRVDVRRQDGSIASFDLGSYNLLKHSELRRWRRFGFASFYLRRVIPELPNYLTKRTRAAAKRRISRRLDPSKFHPPSDRLLMRELLRATPHEIAPLPEPVDVIVPVYNGLRLLPELFDRLEHNTTTPHRILVVDDASPDPDVVRFLDELPERPGFSGRLEVVRNPRNRGFVGSVNIGMERSHRHVVLLNTDARVPPGWLERLMAPIFADPSVASTTPFSNSATICSFPEFCQDNPLALGLPTDTIDGYFRRLSPDRSTIAMPTGVGFCMGLSRRYLERIGTFDERTYSPGYGEENDWCQRAIEIGGRNVLVHNLFVEHQHGSTFAPETKRALVKRNLRRLSQRHPGYLKDVDTFIVSDPARGLRGLVLALMALEQEGKPLEIIIDHDTGGGANKYRNERIERQLANGGSAILITAIADQRCYRVSVHAETYRGQFVVASLGDLEGLVPDGPRITWFYNCAVGYHEVPELVRFLATRVEDHANRLIASLHDYFPLCPSYCLIGANGAHCGLPDTAACSVCLPANRFAAPGTPTDIGVWRRDWLNLLRLADDVLVFSAASRSLLERAFPSLRAKVSLVPHQVPRMRRKAALKPPATPTGPFKIAVVGAIGYPKGSAVVAAAASHIDKARLPLELVVIGKLDRRLEARCVEMSGLYKPEQLRDRLESHGVHVAWFPSIWPETFSYVTAELMELGCPIACFDLGAPAERVRDYEKGLILPVSEGGAAIERIHAFAVEHWAAVAAGRIPLVEPRRPRSENAGRGPGERRTAGPDEKGRRRDASST